MARTEQINMQSKYKYTKANIAPSAAVLFVSFIFTLALFWSTLGSLIARWLRFDESYGHGFLLLALVAWLFWELKKEFAPVRLKPSYRALSVLIPVLLFWFIGKISGIILFEQLSLPLLWWCGVWFLGGWPLAKSVLFPIGMLYFAIPIWDHLNSFLVLLSVNVESFLLSLSALPVMIDGNRFYIPSGIISIADGCSGLRYLIIGLAFGTLSARLYFSSIKMRALVLALSFVLSLLANWLRIYILILVGYFTEMKSSLMGDHELFGFIVFGLTLLPLFLLIRYKAEPVVIPEYKVEQGGRFSSLLFAFAMLLMLLAIPSLVIHYISANSSTSQLSEIGELSGKSITQQAVPAPVLFQGKALQASKLWHYQSGQDEMTIRVDSYLQPVIGKDFLPYRYLLNRKDWLVMASSTPGEDITYNQLELKSNLDSSLWLARYWFDIAGYQTSNRYLAKLAEIPAMLRGSQQAQLVLILAPCPWQGCQQLLPAMDDLLAKEQLQIQHLITVSEDK